MAASEAPKPLTITLDLSEAHAQIRSLTKSVDELLAKIQQFTSALTVLGSTKLP